MRHRSRKYQKEIEALQKTFSYRLIFHDEMVAGLLRFISAHFEQIRWGTKKMKTLNFGCEKFQRVTNLQTLLIQTLPFLRAFLCGFQNFYATSQNFGCSEKLGCEIFSFEFAL